MAYENKTGYPSVTDILGPWIDKRWFKPVHRKRGSYAHAGMSAYAQNLWFPANKPHWNGYVESGKRWFDKHIKKVLYVEKRLVDDEYRITGQFDLIAVMNKPWEDLIALIDWKTSQQEQKTWKFQLAGYMHMALELTKIDIRIAVRLREDARYDCLHNPYEDHNFDTSIILQLSNCYHALGG